MSKSKKLLIKSAQRTLGLYMLFLPLTSGHAETMNGLWNAVISLLPTEINNEADVGIAHSQLITRMQTKGAQATVQGETVVLSGEQGIDQLRTVLFDELEDAADFLRGPVELTLTLPAGDTTVRLELESRPTTGSIWTVRQAAQSRYVQVGEPSFEMRHRGMGAPAVQTIEIKPQGKGENVVHLVYQRSFERNRPLRSRVSLQITQPTTVIDLTDPTPVKSFSVEDNARGSSTDHSTAEAIASLPLRTEIPASYDARTLGIIPPVRDQGDCGACWAFGTVGVMETAVKLGGGPLDDLSEQFLISCNLDYWSCDGGLTASKYHYNTLGDNQNTIGAVLESTKPYTASNGSCPTEYAKAYQASGWKFLSTDEFTMASNDQIKNAIMTYGAVTAGVCVDNGWYSYTSGVYSSGSNVCYGSTNHQIVLVGWDDATSSWILRNSWSADWGEAGYMRIKYDPSGATSRVGEGASWIAYTGGPPTTYNLTVNSTGATKVAITADPTSYGGVTNYTNSEIPKGTAITLTAPATAGSNTFLKWIGCDTTTDTNCAIAMNANKTVTVNYGVVAKPDFTITKIVLDPTRPTANNPFAATVTVKNQGGTADGGWLDVWLNQAGAQLRCPAEGNQFLAVGKITGGTTQSFTFTGLMARSKGVKTFRAFIDSQCQTIETKENNNQKILSYTVDPGSSGGGFNEQFNSGNASNWSRDFGDWSVQNGAYHTNGSYNLLSTSTYNAEYTDVDYSVQIARYGSTYEANAIYIRATGKPGGDYGFLPNGYSFEISADGYYSIWKGVNGNWSNLQEWTESSALNTGSAWNTLRVVAKGSAMQFFINGTLVWKGNDSSLTKGRVGLAMYQDDDASDFQVDWATLSTNPILSSQAAVPAGKSRAGDMRGVAP